jgi:2-oxoisovalerate dehydrogenase E1 component
MEAVHEHVSQCRALVIVDETRRTGGGVAHELLSRLTLAGIAPRSRIVAAADTYIPLGPAADLVLVAEDDIVSSVEQVHAEAVADAGRTR